MSKTIRERREELGLSREDLAERLGVPPLLIGRWEDIGFTEELGSPLADFFARKLLKVLEAKDGLRVEYVPASPKPGDFVIAPPSEKEIADLVKLEDELDLRITVPCEYGLKLISPSDLTDEDHMQIEEHLETERRYSEDFTRMLESMVDVFGAESGEWKDGQTVNDRLEEMDRQLGEDLDRESGGSE